MGLNVQFARSIGIMVDHRRTNKCTETQQLNVERLKNYLSKLVLLPRKEGKPKRGNNGRLSDVTEKAELTQNTHTDVLEVPCSYRVKNAEVSKEMNAFRPYRAIRIERMNQKWSGIRAKKQPAEEK